MSEIIYPFGIHNENYEKTKKRIDKSKSYRDLSTIMIMPCYSSGIHPRVVQSISSLMAAMNQKFYRIFTTDMEVGAAYSETINGILAHPDLSEFKYLFFCEHDNIFPPDTLLKLYENMDEYDVASGIYFTKGEGGMPMSYGRVDSFPVNFIPFLPPADSVTQVRGVGMGCCLCKLEIFKDSRLDKPFFRTVQEFAPNTGARSYTQDLEWCERIGKLGRKICVDTRVKVGHMDLKTGTVW